jgi:hypothetical protein
MQINTGRWTEAGLDQIIRRASGIADAGLRIAFISELFLGTGYMESTLPGDASADEEIVINLSGMDCFTFLDYVEAMRLSVSFAGFLEMVKKIRYKDSIVSYKSRNHFFTDWITSNAAFVIDASEIAGRDKTSHIVRQLNGADGDTVYIRGIAPFERRLSCIPAAGIDQAVINRLRTGDYIGIWSLQPGLDVSHVGICIKQGPAAVLRHAASRPDIRKVIDEDLYAYVGNSPGIIVIRPK